ncbi:MAG: hypothetical protein U9Q69_03740 [Nanoarchaeota archaeon]|nr:hypothetical protein [Nanoarchaeota archaeon]
MKNRSIRKIFYLMGILGFLMMWYNFMHYNYAYANIVAFVFIFASVVYNINA